MPRGCPYGTHRALEPRDALPQPAWRLDNRPALYDNELLIDVETLNVDSASFRQISEAEGGDPDRIGAHIMGIVQDRGKLHNPVTGSGGMLIGTVAQVGPGYPHPVEVGARIATLVSLSLTPLWLDAITAVIPSADRVDVRGKAVLFESGIFARLPDDIPRHLALAVLDVCGAPAQTALLVKPGMRVLVLGGGGKSGLLCSYVARRMGAEVIVMDYAQESLDRARRLGAATEVHQVDATRPLDVLRTIGEPADLTLSCVNVPGVEMSAILATKKEGTVYFFSMATSFTAAALGAEGVGSGVRMLIGNGYTPGHADLTLDLLRESGALRSMLEEMISGRSG